MSAASGGRSATAAGSDRALARYVRRTVYPYSPYYRDALDAAGLGRKGIRDVAGLARLPPTDLARLTDGGELVLRPDLSSMRRYGSRPMAIRSVLAQLLGTLNRFNRAVVEPHFKPLHWVRCGDTPIGYSRSDLQRLGRLGVRWLRMAGVASSDTLVSVLPGGSSVAHWGLVQAGRQSRMAAAHLGAVSSASIEQLAPTVLAGHPAELVELLGASPGVFRNLRTILCISEPPSSQPSEQPAALRSELDLRTELALAAGDAVVVWGWAPSGVRAVWTECRETAIRGRLDRGLAVHVWPDADVIEIGASGDSAAGELLWTGLGWSGSAALRVRTGAVAELSASSCPDCGRPGPLLWPVVASC